MSPKIVKLNIGDRFGDSIDAISTGTQRSKLVVGQTFGNYSIVDTSIPKEKKHGRKCLCLCSCGVKKYVAIAKLVNGKSTQCDDCRIIDMIKRSKGK